MYASAEEQIQFADAVKPTDAYSEFVEWWFEDWHPASTLFQEVFSLRETDLLENWTESFNRADQDLGDRPYSVLELHRESAWRNVMRSALDTLSQFPADWPDDGESTALHVLHGRSRLP